MSSEAQPVPSAQTLARQFRDPPRDYGPIDCWWWEAGQLDEEKMRWQLEEMDAKGVAGTWFYPRFRSGDPLASDPPYWTDEWWDFTRFSLEEHQRLGMVTWLNDWTARQFFQDRLRAERDDRPALAGRRLALHVTESESPGLIAIDVPAGEEVLQAAAYRTIDGQLDDASRLDLADQVAGHRLEWEAEETGWLVAMVTAQPHDLDYLHRSVADRWLEHLLGEYEDKLGDFVGTTLQAHGTDEVFILNGSTLYSGSLLDRFRSEKGYDPTPYLVGLFRDIGTMTDKIRCDYYDVMVNMVEENLYAPMAQGLEERGLLFIEFCPNGKSEDMLSQTYNYGDFFRYMSHYTIPGNEENSRRTRTFQAKMASSIADLYGRERVGVCAYWGTGWGHTTAQNLAWTHENYALGINLYNRHGVLYSTMGGWYEWVPPEIHFRQPYWQYWKHFTEYVTRLSYILSQGVHQPDVAFLYPLTTIHAHWPAGRMSPEATRVKFNTPEDFGAAAHEASKASYDVAKRIYRSGIDLDFVDDRSLCRGRVDEGQLLVSDMAFRAIVLPPMTTIRTQTIEKIKAFHDSGGTVAAVGRLPHASPEQGRDDENIRTFLEGIFGVSSSDGIASTVQGPENEAGGKAFFFPAGSEASIADTLSGAIERDVTSSEGDLVHTHRKIGDVDLYFMYHARDEQRRISVVLRAGGEPEIWNAFTGEKKPLHRFEILDDGRTKVHLDMEPHEGVLLVLNPPRGRPRLVHDDLTLVTSLESGNQGLEVRGFADTGGEKAVCVAHGGKETSASATVDEPEAPLLLDGPWSFHLEPTMDNRWGDFRYPASTQYIGAEARRFRYKEEEDENPGVELGWHQPELDDEAWEEVTYSYGPYWWTIGPFDGEEPKEIAEQARAGVIDSDHWQKYSFSQKFGHESSEAHNALGGGLRGVSEGFLFFDTASDDCDTVRYLFTNVYAPEATDYHLDLGGTAAFSRQAWVNGDRIVSVSSEATDVPARAAVRLDKGWNPILLRLVQPRGERLSTYAVLYDEAEPATDPRLPLLRWFLKPQQLTFDVTPKKEHRVGWYRFSAPPGLSSMDLNLQAEGVTAWIDGQPVDVSEDGRVSLKAPVKETSRIALRVEQEPGCYAGAAFPLPVAFSCTEGSICLGDWCEYGLATYSGGAMYRKTVEIQRAHLKGKVMLDLGKVSTTAEVFVNEQPASVRMTCPYRFDVTDLVAEGTNEIQVKVVNTMANHMSTFPTKYVYEGQTLSGLLGPVTLQFLSPATFRLESQ